MASNTREQLETWLKTIEINGSVVDVGAIHMPIKGRTKTWNVIEYKMLDIKPTRQGYVMDYIWDLNQPRYDWPQFDNVFCIEVMSHIYDPMAVLGNCNRLCKKGGRLFVSVHFLYPNHVGGLDCLRYTKAGIRVLLTENGFDIISIRAKTAMYPEALDTFFKGECRVNKSGDEIGYLIEAKKL